MTKDLKKSKDAMGRLYREFSRQHYNKYKQQYPRMRESDLIRKIIKEWEKLDDAARDQLQKTYIERNFLRSDDKEGSVSSKSKESKTKGRRKAIPAKPAKVSPGKKSPGRKSPGRKSPRKIKEIKHESDKDKDSSDYLEAAKSAKAGDSDSDRSVPIPGKTKKIKKVSPSLSTLRNGEYIQFFKYYYERLSGQHPKWTPVQISTIIKLLWKKKNAKPKERGVKREGKAAKLRALKGISGRMAFKKAKLHDKIPKDDIPKLWKQLPKESKIKWEKEGKGWRTLSRKRDSLISKTKNILKSGADNLKEEGDAMSTNLSFMKKNHSLILNRYIAQFDG